MAEHRPRATAPRAAGPSGTSESPGEETAAGSSDSVTDPTAALLDLLDLSPAEGAQTDEEIFVGTSARRPSRRVFGGQVLAQSLIAAMRTVEPTRDVHSMHGYFLRAGDADKPITFGVQRLRDGRSFSARRTHAYQNGVPILSMIASFQEPDDGVEHQDPMPAGVPDPEDLPTTADLLGGFDHPVARAWAYERPFDIRHIDAPLYLTNEGSKEPRNAVWMRGPRPDAGRSRPAPRRPRLRERLHPARIDPATARAQLDPARHECGEPRPCHVVAPAGQGRRVAPLRAEFAECVRRAGLAAGRIYNRGGELVASVAQEGMIRIPRD